MTFATCRSCVALALGLFALSGCILPPAISIASNGIDGLSYLTSGKSMSDHAISEATGEDCALFRVLTDDSVCRSNERTQRGQSVDDHAVMLAAAPEAGKSDASRADALR